MRYFTVQAASPREALEKMRLHYGEQARILTHKNVRRGGFFGFFAREGVEITGYVPQTALGPQTAVPEGTGFQKLPSKSSLSLEEAKQKILAEAKKEQTFQHILKEIQALKDHIGSSAAERKAKPQGIAKIEETMRRNDFSEMFMEKILRRVRHDFSLENLENIPALEAKVLEWIGEGIKIYHPLKYLEKESKVFIIVGPTGVGKTTTIAKLAAANGVGNNQLALRRVKIVTIDNYRIAARRQIETYAEIMRIPVACAESGAEFKKVLALSEDMDLILVDTIGKSPRDLSKLAEMKEILDAAGSSSETHLAVSATTKASDVEEILKQFEPFRYKAIILTKLDETMRVGNIISVLVMANKPISYIADGQGVPQDIEEASVVRLLMNLDGFRIDREQIEEKFGKREKLTDKHWS